MLQEEVVQLKEQSQQADILKAQIQMLEYQAEGDKVEWHDR